MKKMLAMMVLGGSLLSAPVAMAAPVELSGDASIAYKHNSYSDGTADDAGSIYTLKVMAKLKLGDGWSAYTRFGAQRAAVPALSDFNVDHYTDDKSVASLDQFGFTYETDKLTYKIGRQDVTVGTTALLYSRSDSNIGRRSFVDGLTVNGKVGAVDLFVLAAQEDNDDNIDNKVYAVRGGYNLTPDLNVGLTLGRFNGDNGVESSNHWAVDSTYTYGKHTWTAEYTKSNLSGDNKAYAASWNYAFDGKTTLGVTGFRVETLGDMGGQSDFDNGEKGVHYSVSHALKDNLSMEVVYKDQKAIDSGLKDRALEATLTYSF